MKITRQRRVQYLTVVTALGLSVMLTSCGGDPTSTDEEAPSDTIVVGSANFPENKIIAEIYAQALEANDVKVSTNLDIGAREAYIKGLQDDSISVIPEYSGNLLLYFDDDATATEAGDVVDELDAALPDDLEILEPASAENKDSLNVTSEFAAKNNVSTIGDLADLDDLSLAANPEFRKRSYGIPGLKKVYDVEIADQNFDPINDGGGEATLGELLDGKVEVADIYSTTPSILEHKLVTLEDPEHLFAAQNVVPLIRSDKVSDDVQETLDAVSDKLSTADLLELNAKNQGEDKTEPSELAADWLEAHDLV